MNVPPATSLPRPLETTAYCLENQMFPMPTAVPIIQFDRSAQVTLAHPHTESVTDLLKRNQTHSALHGAMAVSAQAKTRKFRNSDIDAKLSPARTVMHFQCVSGSQIGLEQEIRTRDLQSWVFFLEQELTIQRGQPTFSLRKAEFMAEV